MNWRKKEVLNTGKINSTFKAMACSCLEELKTIYAKYNPKKL